MKFYDYREKESVLKNCKKLKETNITISHDDAGDTVEIRRKLWKSAASDRAKGAQVKLVHDKIKRNGDTYGWDVAREERYLYENHADKQKHGYALEAAGAGRSTTRNESMSSDPLGTPFSSPQTYLRLLLFNARSIVNKVTELEYVLLSGSPHVVAITETWLHSYASDNCIVPEGCKIFRSDRDSRGAGVAIIVKNCYGRACSKRCTRSGVV